MDIIVNTGDLRSNAQVLQDSSAQIAMIVDQISKTVASVNPSAYDGQLAAKVQSIASPATGIGVQIEQRSRELGEELSIRAASFEAANEADMSATLRAVSQMANVQNASPLMSSFTSLNGLQLPIASAILALGGFSGGILAWITHFIPFPLFSQQGISPTIQTTLKPPSVSFGDLAEKAKQEEQQRIAREAAKINWWKTNGLNQIEPGVFATMNKYSNNPYNACGPTALAMAINYNNFVQGKTDKIITPSTLVDQAGKAGFFGDKLISFSELSSLAKQNGFRTEPILSQDGHAWVSLDDLSKQAQQGTPAIVLAKYGYDNNHNYVPTPTKDFDHFVLVTGVSQDGQTVTVVNPHPGTLYKSNSDVIPTSMNVDDFKKVWVADFRQNKGQGILIYPN